MSNKSSDVFFKNMDIGHTKIWYKNSLYLIFLLLKIVGKGEGHKTSYDDIYFFINFIIYK